MTTSDLPLEFSGNPLDFEDEELDGGDGDASDPGAAGPTSGSGAAAPLHHWQAAASLDGLRLDKAIALMLPHLSRMRVRELIEEGAAKVNGVNRRPRDRVQRDDHIVIEERPSAPQLAFRPEPMPLDIRYEDQDVLVLCKPAGLVVHPAAGHWSGTLLNGLLAYDPNLAQRARAGIVHRLDAQTSGLMVVARTALAQQHLVAALRDHLVTREYWAIVQGLAPQAGTIDRALERDPRNVLRFHVSSTGRGRHARTHFRRIATAQSGDPRPGSAGPDTYSWLQCRLETGRTHQIRVHLESIGHPLVNDPVYRKGAHPWRPPVSLVPGRQLLHAYHLEFEHPRLHTRLAISAQPPADMQGFMQQLGWQVPDLRERIDD